ncbi:acyl carrier protein [Microtetraspora niveoalba]|uniref:acyl carrier protein n=1 Tax=Microtetraspora niveoalba TaxID=46175 RepID=UPI00083558A7|nr:acyl carrier protein [Microtetraspora niveoalba]
MSDHPDHPDRSDRSDRSGNDVRRWLTERVAHYLERSPAEIDPGVKLRAYGWESIHALGLCVDIEETVGLLVEPTLTWDRPTVDALAAHLTELLAGGRVSAPPERPAATA